MSGDILDRIDAATGCQQCEGPLGDSPSGDFCSETCQTEWAHARVGASVDQYGAYRARWLLGDQEVSATRFERAVPVADYGITADGRFLALSERAMRMEAERGR